MAKQALQFFKKPPKKIGALIELVNCFPSDLEHRKAITPVALRECAEAENEKAENNNREDFLTDSILNAVKDLPGKLVNYVYSGFWDGGKSRKGEYDVIKEGDIVARYEQLWDAYFCLRTVAQNNSEGGKPHLWMMHTLYAAPMWLEIDARGMLQSKRPLFFEVIEEEQVEAARIRECQICKRIFWAGRHTIKCCSPHCANTFRVHRHRYKTDEEKAAFKARKIAREKRSEREVRKRSASTKKGK
jgi:hypothetical protein